MIFFPLGVLFALGLMGLLGVVFVAVQIGFLGAAFARAGLPPGAVPLILVASLVGSGINIPIRRLAARCCPPRTELLPMGFRFRLAPAARHGQTILAVNLGGAVIPSAVSVYLIGRAQSPAADLLAAALVAAVVHRVARLVPGFGISVPLLLPPLVAAAAGLLLAPRESAQAAYVAGTLGCLVGADLWNLRKIVSLGAPVASIGGAGTFDGVFLSGILAAFLA